MSMFASLQQDTLGAVKAEDLVAKEAQIHGWRSAVQLARREYITSMNLSLPKFSVRNESLFSSDNF